MKKILLVFVSFVLLVSLVSCIGSSVIKFKDDRSAGDLYYEFSDGIKTVTNYHPYNFFAFPNYQELVQYGEGAGLENEGKVYFIYIVDTSMNSDDPQAYYCAEFDGETRELLCEDGEYFSTEEEKNAAIERLVGIIDSAYFK